MQSYSFALSCFPSLRSGRKSCAKYMLNPDFCFIGKLLRKVSSYYAAITTDLVSPRSFSGGKSDPADLFLMDLPYLLAYTSPSLYPRSLSGQSSHSFQDLMRHFHPWEYSAAHSVNDVSVSATVKSASTHCRPEHRRGAQSHTLQTFRLKESYWIFLFYHLHRQPEHLNH